MRIAIGGIAHETNTYAVASFGTTPIESFDVHRGDEILDMAGGRTFIGGMLDAARAASHDIAPTLHAWAQPSGTIEADAYRRLKQELIDALEAAMPVDAVVLDTHGAGIVDGIDDLEADLGASIRTLIGDSIPLVTTLDLHGSITPEMGEVYDLLLGIYDYPHVDMYDRGIEAIEALPHLISGAWVPTTRVEPLPLLLPTATTDISPAKDIRQLCLDVAAEPGFSRAAFFHGFPFTDIPAAGSSIVVTTNNDMAGAREIANRIAEQVWQRREDFRLESLSPEIAINHALRLIAERDGSKAPGPIVVNDTADNPGGGSPGDATHVLRALIEANPEARSCFGFIYDPDVAAQAHAAGVGSTINIVLGGKHDDVHGSPLELHVYVKSITDGRFVHTSQMLAGVPGNYGPMARLQVGGRAGLDVLVGSKRSQVFDREVFTLHGIDVTQYDLVVLKSSQHFRAGFAELADEIITADSPGLTTLRVENFDHPRVDGPRWPIDPAATWAPS